MSLCGWERAQIPSMLCSQAVLSQMKLNEPLSSQMLLIKKHYFYLCITARASPCIPQSPELSDWGKQRSKLALTEKGNEGLQRGASWDVTELLAACFPSLWGKMLVEIGSFHRVTRKASQGPTHWRMMCKNKGLLSGAECLIHDQKA